MENSEERRLREIREIEMMMEQARFRAAIQRLNEQRTGQSSSSSSGGAAGGGTLIHKTSSTPAIDTGEVYLFSEVSPLGTQVEVIKFNTNDSSTTNLTNKGTTDFYSLSSSAADPVNGGVVFFANDNVTPDLFLWRFLSENDMYAIQKVCQINDNTIGPGNGIAVNIINGDVIVWGPDKGTGKNYLKKISQETGTSQIILEFNYNLPNYYFLQVCSSEKPGYVNLIYVYTPLLVGQLAEHIVFEIKIPSTPQLINVNQNNYDLSFTQSPINSANVAANGTIYAFNQQINNLPPFPSTPSQVTKVEKNIPQLDFIGVGNYRCVATVR